MAESRAAQDAGVVLLRREQTETPRKRQRLVYGIPSRSPGGTRHDSDICDVKYEPTPDKEENQYEKKKRIKRNSAERTKLKRKADPSYDAMFRAAEAARLRDYRERKQGKEQEEAAHSS